MTAATKSPATTPAKAPRGKPSKPPGKDAASAPGRVTGQPRAKGGEPKAHSEQLPGGAPATATPAPAPAPAPAPQRPAPVTKPAKGKAAKPKAVPPAKARRLSALDAAAIVLAKSGKPMRATDMIEKMVEQGLWSSPGGKTPEATLYAAIIREIAAKKHESRFKKHDRGLFVATHEGV